MAKLQLKKLLTVRSLLLLLGVVGVGLLGLFAWKYVNSITSNEPLAVRVTNVSSNSATISWVTAEKKPGQVIVRESNFAGNISLSSSGAIVGYDDRDYTAAELRVAQKNRTKAYEGTEEVKLENISTEVEVSQKGSYNVHHATVRGLDPQTTYYFMLGDGLTYAVPEETPNTFTTYALSEELYVPNPAYGKVKDWLNRAEPVADGVVYMHMKDPETDETSTLQSAALSENGSWYIDLSNFKDSNGEEFLKDYSSAQFDSLLEVLEIETGVHGKYKTEIPTTQDAPAFDIHVNSPDLEKIGDTISPLSNLFNREVNLVNAVFAQSGAAECAPGDTEDEVYGECCGDGQAREVRRCIDAATGVFYYKMSSCDYGAPQCNQGTVDAQCNNNGIRDCQGYSPGNCEEGVDCGNSACGACAAAPNGGIPAHCSNGVLDSGHEMGVDCGGECPTCQGIPAPANEKSEACSPAGCVGQEGASGGGGGTAPPVDTETGDSALKACCVDLAAGAVNWGDHGSSCPNPEMQYFADKTEAECNGMLSSLGGTTSGVCCNNPAASLQYQWSSAGACTGNATVESGPKSASQCQQLNYPTSGVCCLNPTGSPKYSWSNAGSCGTSEQAVNGVNSSGECVAKNNGGVCCHNPTASGSDKYTWEASGSCPTAAAGAISTYPVYTINTKNLCAKLNGSKGVQAQPNGNPGAGGGNGAGNGNGGGQGTGGDVVWSEEVGKSSYRCVKDDISSDKSKFCTLDECNAAINGTGYTCAYNEYFCSGVGTTKYCRFYYQYTSPATQDMSFELENVCEANCIGSKGVKGTCEKVEYEATGRISWECKFKEPSSSLLPGTYDEYPKAGLVSRVGAQDVPSVTFDPETRTYVTQESGVYKFIYNNQIYTVKLTENDGEVLIYIDTNGNDIFEDGIDITVAEDPVELQMEFSEELHQHELKTGYNFISFDYISSTYSSLASEFLVRLNKDYDNAFYSIASYDSGRWKIVGYRGGTDSYGAEDFQIVPGVGYIIRSKRDVTVDIGGFKVTDSVPVAFAAGWNLVAVHGADKEYTAESLIDALDNSNLDADNVSRWTSALARYEGLQKSPDQDGVMQVYGFDFPISARNAYFVRVVQGEGTWTP